MNEPKKRSWKRKIRDWLVSCVYERSHNMSLRQAIAWKSWQLLSGANRGAYWPVHPSSVIVHAERIKLGKKSRPGYSNGCYIQAINGIEFGDYVGVAPGVTIISANHNPENQSEHLPAPPIKFGSRCWIGAHAVILPGVELGEEVIVAAGAVVTKSFPSRVIVAGVPARVARHLAPRPTENAEPQKDAPQLA